MRMFDLAAHELARRGHDVWGCYMSPVNDGYGKAALAPVQQRLEMCRLAAEEAPGVMVDGWEAKQRGYVGAAAAACCARLFELPA
jgi:nicotinamide mononucleotide adenylyltransferase